MDGARFDGEQQKRVLLIEDDLDTAAVLSELVAAIGHEPTWAGCGEEGLAILARVRPHVVLLDLALPDLTGYQIARRLRETDVARDVLLVAVTGFGGAAEIESTRAAGFDQHVIKPVGLTELRWILGEPHAPSRVRPSLLIIDEPAVTASLARVLADDFAIQTASTCDVLGECLDEHRFDRILCDAKLARGLGDDVVRRLRARSERSTVVWMLEPASGTETGPELRKPFGRAALFEAVGARPLPITAGLDEERRHRADALLATMSRELGAAPTMLGRRQ